MTPDADSGLRHYVGSVLNPHLTHLTAEARIADLRASAARHRSAISDDSWSEANRHENDGEAITLATLIADPFHHSVATQQLLRARAVRLQRDRRPSWRRRLLHRVNPPTYAATPSAAMRGAASQPNR